MTTTPKRPWQMKTARLGLSVGGSTGTPRNKEIAIGWMLFEMQQKTPDSFGAFRTSKTTAADAVTAWKQLGSPSPVVIYQYDKASFKNSFAFAEGITLEQHRELCRASIDALKKAGATVEVEFIFGGKQ